MELRLYDTGEAEPPSYESLFASRCVFSALGEGIDGVAHSHVLDSSSKNLAAPLIHPIVSEVYVTIADGEARAKAYRQQLRQQRIREFRLRNAHPTVGTFTTNNEDSRAVTLSQRTD